MLVLAHDIKVNSLHLCWENKTQTKTADTYERYLGICNLPYFLNWTHVLARRPVQGLPSLLPYDTELTLQQYTDRWVIFSVLIMDISSQITHVRVIFKK